MVESLLNSACSCTYCILGCETTTIYNTVSFFSVKLIRDNWPTLNRTGPFLCSKRMDSFFHQTPYLTFILLFIYLGEHSCVTFSYPRRQAKRQWFHCSISSCSVSAQQNMTEQMNQLSVLVAVLSQGGSKRTETA